MKITVRPRNIEWNDELQKQVERIIAFAVDRHGSRVIQISVYLADLNGPRGGVDKVCQITADLRGTMPVLILERGDDLLGTVNRAARRLGYRIAKRIRRVHTARTRVQSPPARPAATPAKVLVAWPEPGRPGGPRLTRSA